MKLKLWELPLGFSDSEVFNINVEDKNRALKLKAISIQTANENENMIPIDINDQTGNDKDEDGEIISYTCQFSRTEESVTASTANSCSKARGLFLKDFLV